MGEIRLGWGGRRGEAQVHVLEALALGWSPDLDLVPMVASVVLAVAAFTGMALVLAGRLSALVCLAAANALFILLLLLSGMVFPLDELPSGLEAAAEALPSTALAEALRGALGDADIPGRAWAVLAVWAIAGVALAVALFRWEPSD